MSSSGSKNHIASTIGLEVANSPTTRAPSVGRPDAPDLEEALGIIVSAFVDIGFGVSAVQQAENAANDNRDLIRIAADFPAQSS